jgi:predicted DsbA family dithiol-disulfide isomerase
MKVEIWSDVMCPFCYIGKRRFEEAMAQFPHAGEVLITWKSFQLNPDMVTDPSLNINQYLADVKGWQLEYAQQMNQQVTEMAAAVGLDHDVSVLNTMSFRTNLRRLWVGVRRNLIRFTYRAYKISLSPSPQSHPCSIEMTWWF